MANTHSRPVADGRGYWQTERLWALSAGLPVRHIAIADITEFDQNCWFGQTQPTVRAVAQHVRQINEADLSHPVILAADGGLMDGGHRIAKAWLAGDTDIAAVRFATDPEPDWIVPPTQPEPPTEQLGRAVAAVGRLIVGIRQEQWSAPTPCVDWTVRELVGHLVGLNLVFAAMLTEQQPPERGVDRLGDDPVGAYRASAADLAAAFERPGILDRTFAGPLGSATGADRLYIRLYDLLAHGWDLARATGQPVGIPDELAERSLAFVRIQLAAQQRTGRFAPAQAISDDAPANDRLAAFLGRSIDWEHSARTIGV
jgi:uncharacterized protein (TIGR03086 family)